MHPRYIGIDVHTQSCTCAVMGPSGKQLRKEVVDTSAEALIKLVKSIRGERHLCFEEGMLSAWLYEELEPHVHELVVIHPEKPDSGSKNDSIDAWDLADKIRLGAIKRQVFTSRGVRTSRVIYNPDKREQWLALLPTAHRQLAKLLGEELDSLQSLRDEARDRVMEQSREHERILAILQSAPGIGPIRAAKILAIVVTPHRFRTRNQFWAYSGFAIVTRNSAEWMRDHRGNWVQSRVNKTRGLNKKRHPVLKDIFKGAATTVIEKLPDHALHADYQRCLKNTKPNLAKLTLARRIAAIVLAMWKNEEAYDPAKHADKTA